MQFWIKEEVERKTKQKQGAGGGDVAFSAQTVFQTPERHHDDGGEDSGNAVMIFMGVISKDGVHDGVVDGVVNGVVDEVDSVDGVDHR